ncbi:hypothetical protein C2G38_2178300 [Gigaspora rosea]|uniref:Uncharacterized protein n=1 Tax=Gigaspora rosea TaxID=44941 RepID=A0A397VEA8_9GLOM|nr:hypothetical protein C2G38_2178300 [Gigaspora rosea]CAG8472776.1 13634_t:CDS:2 [Gigaspora rosea]
MLEGLINSSNELSSQCRTNEKLYEQKRDYEGKIEELEAKKEELEAKVEELDNKHDATMGKLQDRIDLLENNLLAKDQKIN